MFNIFNRRRNPKPDPALLPHQQGEQALDDATVSLVNGDYKAARGYYNMAIKLGNPSTKFAAYLGRSTLHRITGNARRADSDMTEYAKIQFSGVLSQVQQHPDNTTGLPLSDYDYPEIARLFVDFRREGWGEVAQIFRKQVRDNPSSPLSWMILGYALCRAQETEAGMDAYNEAIRLDPEFDAAYGLRGDRHRRFQRYDAALQDINIAIQLDQTKATHWYHRGILYSRMSEQTQTAQNVSVDDVPIRFALNANSGDLAMQSLRDYTKAINIDPTFALAHTDRGYLWDALGSPERAFYDHHCFRKIELSWSDEFPQSASVIAGMAEIEGKIREELGV